MRLLPASVVIATAVFVVFATTGCPSSTPAQHVEKTVRALYAGALDDREKERDALRVQGTDRLRAYLSSIDASCSEILNNEAPNHGLAGPALADFNRNCLDERPLTCGGGSVVGAVDVGAVTADGASASVHVGGQIVDVGVKLVAGKFVVDDVLCR